MDSELLGRSCFCNFESRHYTPNYGKTTAVLMFIGTKGYEIPTEPLRHIYLNPHQEHHFFSTLSNKIAPLYHRFNIDHRVLVADVHSLSMDNIEFYLLDGSRITFVVRIGVPFQLDIARWQEINPPKSISNTYGIWY